MSNVQTPVAKVTEKATGNVWFLYRVASETDPKETYLVWVRNGVACHCSCKARHFNKGKACKHMMKFQNVVNDAPATFQGKRQATTTQKPTANKRDSQTLARQLAPTTAPTVAPKAPKYTARDLAPLNGNRPFSLMRR